MEDSSKNYFLGLPPFVKKPPPPTTSPMNSTGSYGGCQKQYLMNHGGASSSSRTKPHLGPLNGVTISPSMDPSNKKTHQFPTPLSRNPITSITPSSAKNDGIIVSTQKGVSYEMKWGRIKDPNMDPKRIKRILSNRISAQKSRMKKVQSTTDMEKKMKDLQVEILMLNSHLENEQVKQLILRTENGIMKDKLSAVEERVKLLYAEKEELEAAKMQLTELYVTQQNMWMQEDLNWNSTGMEQPVYCNSYEFGSQLMVDQGELDPALNFTSWIMDPPNNLM